MRSNFSARIAANIFVTLLAKIVRTNNLRTFSAHMRSQSLCNSVSIRGHGYGDVKSFHLCRWWRRIVWHASGHSKRCVPYVSGHCWTEWISILRIVAHASYGRSTDTIRSICQRSFGTKTYGGRGTTGSSSATYLSRVRNDHRRIAVQVHALPPFIVVFCLFCRRIWEWSTRANTSNVWNLFECKMRVAYEKMRIALWYFVFYRNCRRMISRHFY